MVAQEGEASPDPTGQFKDYLCETGERALIRLCRGCPLGFAIAALIVPLGARAGSSDTDGQLWTELDVTAPVAANTTITGIARLRFSETLANPVLASPGADLNYDIGPWTLSAGYRYDATAQREPETIGGKTVTIKQDALLMGKRSWRFGRSTLQLRLRLDDTLSASSNPYRARVRVEYRWATEGLRRVGYLFTNDEVFYEFQDQKWFRNRLKAGLNLTLTPRTDLQLYYLHQYSDNSTPATINGLGLTCAVTFE